MDHMNMGRITRWHLLATGLLLLGCIGNAHAQAFAPGTSIAALSAGVGGHYRAYNAYTSQTPALGLHYERAVSELGPGVLGLGGYLGYKSLSYHGRPNYWNNGNWNNGNGNNGPWHNGNYDPYYDTRYQWTYLILGFRGAWHYNEWHGADKLDTYAGLMLSYNSVTMRDRSIYPNGYVHSGVYGRSHIGLSGFLGVRYFFTESLGAQLELGYGVSMASLGIAFKF
jgi:hypothetical protein